MDKEQAQGTMEILKARYFDLALKEKRGETPEITKELDKIERSVNALKTQVTHK